MAEAQENAQQTAARGQAIYESSLRSRLEPHQRGRIAAIDVNSEEYEVADNVLAACQALLTRVPNAEVWVVRIGENAVYHLGWHGSRPR